MENLDNLDIHILGVTLYIFTIVEVDNLLEKIDPMAIIIKVVILIGQMFPIFVRGRVRVSNREDLR